jgi:2-polyprenyl-6-hydroxyphenyl methylase/3-demethylubiquinone-9 3-methyltransferase
MSIATNQHNAEVRQGLRFEFGKNWQRFLKTLTDERIALAEQSLIDCLGLSRLDGLRFLDIGSGSGLFSYAARRLGATVTSFDYDPASVACTAELRRRYFPGDANWTVLRGSVLDREFVTGLGSADIVYSWGVLHHTGAMQAAFANVKTLVPVGGRLFIAIYNDLGDITDRWWQIKQQYNALPQFLRLPFAVSIIAASESRILAGHLRQRDLAGYIKTWTDYQHISVRGMSRWHDWIDWIGGFPYERASIDAIVDTFAGDGFRLTKLVDRSTGYGCNEFVFRREAAAGIWIDQKLPGSRLFGRRFGLTLLGARAQRDGSLHGYLRLAEPPNPEAPWLVLQGERLLGTANGPDGRGLVRISPDVAARMHVGSDALRLAAGVVEPVNGPFTGATGHMHAIAASHLAALADNAAGSTEARSPVFVFEDDRQLPLPHSLHSDIQRRGRGRFSHWGEQVLFATADGSDPNRNGRNYSLVYPVNARPIT